MRDRISSTLAVVALSVGTLLAGVTVGWSHSNDSLTDQVHGCIANATKVVRIVGVSGKCKTQPKETAIHWPATGGGIRVVDSSVPPKTVGLLISTTDQAPAGGALVAINANGTLVTVGITRSGFDNVVDLFYEHPDCAGQAFFLLDERMPPYGLVEPDGTLTYPDLTQIQPRIMQSQARNPGAHCGDSHASILAAPTLTFDLASQGLTPPFSAVAP